MSHRRRNRPESGICREPPAYLEGCSSIIGLWHKKLCERQQRRENEARLIAAGFLAPREPEPPPKPREEQISFAEWSRRHKA
jgi:hypothetical protein